jgi:hypothetical protein
MTMNFQFDAIPFRTAETASLPVTDFHQPEDVIEAMLQSIQGGELHVRPPLEAVAGSPFLPYIEIGLALRNCLEEPSRRDYLIERLKPHLHVIIGILPAGIQPHGMLPRAPRDYRAEFGFRPLEEISDAELRQWIIDDGGLIYGELKRHELENYFDAIAPALRPGGTMYDLGSGLGKVVMTAALALPFERCVGVELLGYRHRMAGERLQAMLATGERGLQALPVQAAPDAPLRLSSGAMTQARQLLELRSRIAFIENDLFAQDVSDASLVFIYSTCFGPIIDRIAEKLARELPEHCMVTTTTYALQHPGFKLLHYFPPHTVTWTGVFLYERIGALATLPAAPPKVDYPIDALAWEAKVRQEFDAIDARNAG